MSRLSCAGVCCAGLILIASARAVAAEVYIEGINDDLPIAFGWLASSGHEQAFRWTAENTFELTKIEFHSSTVTNCIVRLRKDTGTTPGDIMREVMYSFAGIGWHGEPFAESVEIKAGETFFVTMSSPIDLYTNYVAEGGEQLTYYWSVIDQDLWNGPFSGPAGARIIRFFGNVGSPCAEDLDGSGDVGFADLLQLLASWGKCEACAEDLDGSGDVGFNDLLQILAAWGRCD